MAFLNILVRSVTQFVDMFLVAQESTSLSVTTQVGLSYSPMHNFPRCNQRE